MTPKNIERGQYLFTSLLDCDGCHSERDFTRLGGPMVAGTRGKGGLIPLEGLPGQVNAPNITPDAETGIGSWTDGEKIRAIREGISKDGHMLFPLMPYTGYRYLSDGDVQSLVAYMNTLPAIRNYVPRSNISFFAAMMVKGVPAPVTRKHSAMWIRTGARFTANTWSPLPAARSAIRRRSSARTDAPCDSPEGGCSRCPPGRVLSSNITPDNDTGIGKWDFIRFRDRMHAMREYKDTEFPKVGPERFTLMPWIAYSNLPDHDLESILLYIKSRRAISNFVVPHPEQ